jgi:sialic acid synthase SpsE
MATVKIGDRLLGDDQPPLVIPEIGINHEGEFPKAIQLVDAAVAAGAECVKFQSHIAEMEMLETEIRHEGVSTEREWDIIKRCELTATEEIDLKRYCEEKGLLYLCTPFSREAADRLETMDIAAFKIGSGECNNIPLLQHVARKGRPIILSTGANGLASVRASVEAILALDCPLVLLHCTSAYPTPYELVRLGAIDQLRGEFGLPVGLSDHSMGIYTSLGAVALGACVLEKHFTISRDWPGPDVPISIEPQELRELVVGARAVYDALGGSKTLLDVEQAVIDFAYASVVTIAPVAKGEVLSRDNTWVKRPGTGPIRAKDLDSVLGRVVRRALPAGSQLTLDDLQL